MPGYKFVYFPVRGRGQAIRYILADNGLDYEEESVAMTADIWSKIKPTTPLGQLPVLHDGPFQVAQSNAILRYIARKHGFYGKDDHEAATIDMINDQQEDLRVSYGHLIYKEYETGKADFIKNLPDKLKIFEKVLGNNNKGSGFFVGAKISFADYNIFDLLDNLTVLSPGSLDAFPLLKAFHGRIAAHEKISKQRSSEAFKKMTINGNGKQ